MRRLIDTQDAFNVLSDYYHHNSSAQHLALQEALNKVPTAYAEPHWIPCSERLPEYLEPVITWDGNCYFVEKRIPYIRDEDGSPIKGEWWVSDDYGEEVTDYYPNLRDGAAIAWMPLPEPYEVKE